MLDKKLTEHVQAGGRYKAGGARTGWWQVQAGGRYRLVAGIK